MASPRRRPYGSTCWFFHTLRCCPVLSGINAQVLADSLTHYGLSKCDIARIFQQGKMIFSWLKAIFGPYLSNRIDHVIFTPGPTNQPMSMSSFEGVQHLPLEDRITFEQLATLGSSVKALFDRLSIEIRPQSALATLLVRVNTIAEQWRNGEGQDVKAMIHVTTAMRVIEAVLAAQNDPEAVHCYKRIAKKDVDLFSPTPSQGKDALWELQLLGIFRSRGLIATLGEPDINITISDLTIPIACKKIYSPKNLESQLRSAGSQLKIRGEGGIAALNIDAQLPKDHLILSQRTSDAASTLVDVGHTFLANHQSLIRRMIKSGKFDAVLVSVSCPMENKNVRPRFNVGTESLLWCPAGICSAEGNMRVEMLRIAMKLPIS